MVWATRRNQRLYLYRSERVGGKVCKRYFGNGLLAEVESMRLECKAALEAELRAEKQRTVAAERSLKQQIQSTADLTLGLMVSVGYTNERYRGWRKIPMIAIEQAENIENSCQNEYEIELGLSAPEPSCAPEPSFAEIAAAARQGDRSVMPALRWMMQENPKLAKNNGDLASQTQIHWIDLIAGIDLYQRECLLMRMADLKRELIAETAGTVVEQMLVEQAISTWLQLYYHEDREATRPAENIQLGEFRLKKIDSAFNRHMRSLSALSSMKAVNFTGRMAEAMKSVVQDADDEKNDSVSAPAIQPTHSRLRDSFRRAFDTAPMN